MNSQLKALVKSLQVANPTPHFSTRITSQPIMHSADRYSTPTKCIEKLQMLEILILPHTDFCPSLVFSSHWNHNIFNRYQVIPFPSLKPFDGLRLKSTSRFTSFSYTKLSHASQTYLQILLMTSPESCLSFSVRELTAFITSGTLPKSLLLLATFLPHFFAPLAFSQPYGL